jgi:hypothetical protein
MMLVLVALPSLVSAAKHERVACYEIYPGQMCGAAFGDAPRRIDNCSNPEGTIVALLDACGPSVYMEGLLRESGELMYFEVSGKSLGPGACPSGPYLASTKGGGVGHSAPA